MNVPRGLSGATWPGSEDGGGLSPGSTVSVSPPHCARGAAHALVSGLEPAGEGWFVLNAREAKWQDGHFGAYTRFEGEPRFTQIGVNIGVLAPGQPACFYHGEDNQEDFLVLSGECRLLIEGEERPLRQWDFVHCPPWAEHVFVGAGDGPCAVLMIGCRREDGCRYTVSDLAARYGGSVSQDTDDPSQAYADWLRDMPDAPIANPWPIG